MNSEVVLPVSTIIRVLATALLVYCVVQISPLLMLTFLAILLAATLHPLLVRATRRGLPRWAGITLIVLSMLGSMAFLFAVLIPKVLTQLSGLAETWPRLREQIVLQTPNRLALREAMANFLQHPTANASKDLPKQAVAVGGLALGVLAQFVLFLVLSTYLTVEGSRSWQWFKAFFQPVTQSKLERTGTDISRVISAYVTGQLITSILVTVFSFAILYFLHVPAALVLAVLAGIFDVLPMVGFFLSVIPAALLALTVSPKTALAVMGAYLFYHAIENYLIVPKIYGNRLRVSTLTVLLSLLAAFEIAGVQGAIAILPVVASYPIIERIWLRRYLCNEVVETHAEIQSKPDDEMDKRKSA
jgi:predicted PurR-regulated permease PerM